LSVVTLGDDVLPELALPVYEVHVGVAAGTEKREQWLVEGSLGDRVKISGDCVVQQEAPRAFVS
jgi:hypothetical protein